MGSIYHTSHTTWISMEIMDSVKKIALGWLKKTQMNAKKRQSTEKERITLEELFHLYREEEMEEIQKKSAARVNTLATLRYKRQEDRTSSQICITGPSLRVKVSHHRSRSYHGWPRMHVIHQQWP